MSEQNQKKTRADLDRLGKEARTEIEAYHGFLRRAGVHLFRAGRYLFEAKSLAKEAGVIWADWLAQQQIADSTARQAIDLYRNAKAMGHEEIDLEGLTITEAKIKYGVVAPKPKKEKETAPPATPPTVDNTPPEGKDDTPRPDKDGASPLPPPEGKGYTPPSPPPEGKGETPSPKGFGDRVKERSLLKLDEIYGDETEDRSITLPRATWRLLDLLKSQEEVDDEGLIISRAVREYWLRHGQPVQISMRRTPINEAEPELVYSAATA